MTAPGADFYVAVNGRDDWSGTVATPNAAGTDGPFATLSRARDAVRTIRDRDVTVLVRGGTYRVSETIVFSLADSAGPDQTITYAAFPGEKPLFSAGRPVTGWQRLDRAPAGMSAVAAANVWVANVLSHPAMRPVPDGRSARFFTLYGPGGRLPRARGKGWRQSNSTPRGTQDCQTVGFPRGAVTVPQDLNDVELVVVPSNFWIMNILPVESIDPEKSSLRTSQPGTYPLGKNGITDRPTAWIENTPEVLDKPGEWALDSANGLLYYWPSTGDPGDGVLAPVLTEIVRVEGTIDYEGATDAPVQGLTFRGLTFSHGDRVPFCGRTGWGLQHDWELFDKPTALVRLRGAERCTIEDCEFADSAHTGVRLDLYCQQNRVVGNHIRRIGGVGVLLSGYGPGTKDVNRENEVSNNYIHHIGEVYWGSVAIFAWQSGSNRIAHNHIHHTPYTAICVTGRISRSKPGPGECSRTIRWHETPEEFVKWSWAQREPYLHARENVVESNDIHHAMEVLGDGNCIYVSGTGGGNVVRTNYCHDCEGKYMNAVIRCDDDQHGTVMSHNVCFRTRGHAEGFISKGDNDIVNNVVADLRASNRHRGYIVFPYGSVKGSEIKRNILYSRQRGQIPYHEGSGRGGPPPRLHETDANGNLYFCEQDANWADRHLQTQRPLGVEQNSRNADPLFADLANGDFSFRPDSPALALGIEPIDVTTAGLEPEYQDRLIGPVIRTRIVPPGCAVKHPITVTIETDAKDGTVHFTMDGSEPTESSAVYAEPLQVEGGCVIRARTFAKHGTDGAGASAVFEGPPEPIVEDFENTAVGDTTPGATTSEDEVRTEYTARVTDEKSASGKHCLKFIDGPGQKYAFNPHVYYRLRFVEGVVRGSFDVMVDARSAFYYQWRQYDDKYVSGPGVNIRPGGKIEHDDKTLMALPLGKWIHVEVECGLGDGANGRFAMRVRVAGEETEKVFDGLACETGFERLDWVGLVPNGQDQTVIYVDNLRVAPVESAE